MRHRKKGRQLGRSSSHKKAMLRNLATSLILTEREDDYYEDLYQADGKTPVAPPRYKGRVVTTLHKAKEVRSLVEKCVTIARKAMATDNEAAKFDTEADRNTSEWEAWRKSDNWKQWVEARAPGVAARRRVFDILRSKEAVSILFEDIAPRFEDRPGGYTRVLKLAKPRLGDAGAQAILEFVGKNDRVAQTAEKPAFEVEEDEVPVSETDDSQVEENDEPTDDVTAEANDEASDDVASEEAASEEAASEEAAEDDNEKEGD
ncbi:MAG: bL17 family ribosomal protein [Planctomycetota bacterium]|nr:bL17 family ribosomal protein [Planctomycetota bacterium]